jgi:putative ABC transport system permease protein
MRSLYRALSLPYWRRHGGRLALLVASIALGVATWAATAVLQRALETASRAAASPLAGTADLCVTNGDAGVRRDLAGPLARVPGVRAAHPLVVERVALPELCQRPALLLGVDLDPASAADAGWDVTVENATSPAGLGAWLAGETPVLLGRELDRALPAGRKRLGVLAGGRVRQVTRAGTVEGRGPAGALSGDVLVTACPAAAALAGRPDLVSRIDLRLQPGADLDGVRRGVEAVLAGHAEVGTPEGHDRRLVEMVIGLKVAFTLCGAGALVVALFLVANALAVSAVERRRDTGVLRCLGATRAQVCGLFLGEATLIGLAGAVLGVPLGLALARVSLGPAQQVLSDVFLPLAPARLDVAPADLAGALAAGLGAACLAALGSALRAASEEPVRVLRRVSRDVAPPGVGPATAGAAGTAALGMACLVLRDHLPPRVGTYGGLVLLLAAGLLATPLLAAGLARALRPAARCLLGVGGRLAADHLARDAGRTGVVTAALAAGVGLLLQTGGLIRSNEGAVRDWVDRSIAGDLFVTSGGPLSASGKTLPMAETLSGRLRAEVPEAQVVPMRFRYLDWRQPGRSARVLLLALDAPAYYAANRDRRPVLPDLELYRQLGGPDTALVSENFAHLYGVRPGDPLTLPGSDGPVRLRVIGTVADYSCNRGTVIVDRRQHRADFDAGLVDVLDVYLPPAADPEAVRRRLNEAPWAAGQAVCVLTREELRGHVLGMVSRLYGLTYTQEAVVGLVVFLGMVTALTVAVLQRRRELGLLRAVGATRSQVLGAVLAEALLIGVIGTAAGVLLGVPLEWYTVRVLVVEESGFLCPVRFPWATAAVVAALALAGALAAAVGPGLRAARASVIDGIAYE